MPDHRRAGALEQARKDGLRAEQLFLILDIIKQASRSLDPPTFFRLIVETIYREVKSFSHVSIFEWHPDRGALRAMATAGEGGVSAEVGRDAAPTGMLAKAITKSCPCVSNDLRRDPHGTSPIARLSRSALCIPIKSGGRILALLNIEGREAGMFEPHDAALFEILGEHLANFLQGVRLYEEVRCKSVKIQRITDICRRVFGAPSLQEAVQIAVRAVVDEYGYDGACVAFVSGDGRSLVHQAHHARDAVELPSGYQPELGRGIVGRVASERATVCCNDTLSDPDHVALVPGVRAELCIPLLAGETLVGILDVSARETNAFDSEDVSLMETLGRQLALVMDKARYLEQIRLTRDYLENLVTNAGDGILTLDAGGRIARWNLGMERLLGFTAEEMLDRAFGGLSAVLHGEVAGRMFARGMAGETVEGVEDRYFAKDGRIVDVAVTLSPIRGGHGTVEGVSLIVRDVTERRRIEESMRAMHRQILAGEEKFLGMLERAHDAVFLIDAGTGAVVQANARAEEQTGRGRSEWIGLPFDELHPEDERERARKHFRGAVASGSGPGLELRIARRSGAPLDVEVTPSILNYGGRSVVQWICRDISDKRRAEKEKEILLLQLLQSEKMSAIGQLISGVAHELSNPLTGVIGYAQLLGSEDCEPRIKRGLEKVQAEARRCHRIVQNLLTFARKHPAEKTYININDVVESTLELRSYQMRVDDIRVERELAKDLPRTMGDFHQLQQVILNVIINAHQAFKGARKGGVLTVRSSVAGGRVLVEIADDGPGIPQENLGRIFDPFFTTKPTGHGTGLGLSICYGIVEEHDGRIQVRSAIGRGTTVSIELPLLIREEGLGQAAAPARPAGAAPVEAEPGGRKLLVVDDEPSIVEVLVEILRGCGHEVDTAVNGRQALGKILRGSYDVVISDLKMPGMSGQELFREVSRSRPSMASRFLFSTGDAIARETREFLDEAGKPWIEKPFDVNRLVALVGDVLSEPA